MKAIGARLALAVNRATGHTGHVLADRYHFRLLRTPTEVRNDVLGTERKRSSLPPTGPPPGLRARSRRRRGT
jgi:hypothetical protein